MEMTGGNYDKTSLALRLPRVKPGTYGFGRQQKCPTWVIFGASKNGFSWKFFRGSRTMEGVFLSFPFGFIFAHVFFHQVSPPPGDVLDKIWKLMLLWTELA